MPLLASFENKQVGTAGSTFHGLISPVLQRLSHGKEHRLLKRWQPERLPGIVQHCGVCHKAGFPGCLPATPALLFEIQSKRTQLRHLPLSFASNRYKKLMLKHGAQICSVHGHTML